MSPNNSEETRTVFSTEHGRICPDCGQPVNSHVCSHQKTVLTGDGIVRVSRETKGRKGKGVTLITGILLDHKELKDLGKKLKIRCGTGGTVKDGVIEIQGDQRELMIEELQKKGWTVKLTGG